MAYYHECPDCGGSLDPGEKCDCQREAKEVKRGANSDKDVTYISGVKTDSRARVIGALVGQRV